MARRQIYPLGKNGPREISPGEIHVILAKRSKVTQEMWAKKGKTKRRRSNLDK